MRDGFLGYDALIRDPHYESVIKVVSDDLP